MDPLRVLSFILQGKTRVSNNLLMWMPSKWRANFVFYVPFNISSRVKTIEGDNERICAMIRGIIMD